MRNRAVENRWIGQRIADPEVDITALARAQGVEAAAGPVRTITEFESEMRRALEVVWQGRPYLIDCHVAAGYASAPLSRGE